jgi:RNA polymerase sigma-70 factor (ECF subfamily)
MSILQRLAEKKLLDDINRRDKEAFSKCYDLYVEKIFRHVYYRTMSKELAEDITAEVFKKTWEYLIEPQNQIKNLKAFLYRTALNLIVDYYRNKESHNIFIDEEIKNRVGDSGQSIAEINKKIDKKIELKMVLNAMEKISPEYKEILILRYIDDLSIKEIAKLKEKTENAIYVALHRALKELQKILKES